MSISLSRAISQEILSQLVSSFLFLQYVCEMIGSGMRLSLADKIKRNCTLFTTKWSFHVLFSENREYNKSTPVNHAYKIYE